jgi:hypothetical protein
VQHTPSLIAAFANYIGPRVLDISLFDADEERADLFERLASVCFMSSYAPHRASAVPDHQEALEGSDAVILTVDSNCAQKFLGLRSGFNEPWKAGINEVQQTVDTLLRSVASPLPLLSLLPREIRLHRPDYHWADWPLPLPQDEQAALPWQILRWINHDQPVNSLLANTDDSLIGAWLDSPHTLQIVKDLD